MFTFIKELIGTGTELLSLFFSGLLPAPYYYWFAGIAALGVVQLVREHRAGLTETNYPKRTLLELLVFFGGWVAAVILIRFLAETVKGGVTHQTPDTYYECGAILLTALYFTYFVVFSVQRSMDRLDVKQMVSFLSGFAVTYVLYFAAEHYFSLQWHLSGAFQILLSAVMGVAGVGLRAIWEIQLEEREAEAA